MEENNTNGSITRCLIRMSELEEERKRNNPEAEEEFQSLLKEVDHIVQNTNFNGIKLLEGGEEKINIKVNMDISYAIENETLFVILPTASYFMIEDSFEKNFSIEMDESLEKEQNPIHLEVKDEGIVLYIAPSVLDTIKNVQFSYQEE